MKRRRLESVDRFDNASVGMIHRDSQIDNIRVSCQRRPDRDTEITQRGVIKKKLIGRATTQLAGVVRFLSQVISLANSN
jgi:hypothetical protein